MKVADYCRKVTDVVLELTDVRREDLEGGRRSAEVVDARWMIIKLVREAGYYPSQIAPVMKMTVRQVQAVISSFDIRMRFAAPSLRMNYEAAARLLRCS